MKICRITAVSALVLLTIGCAAKIKQNLLNEPYQTKTVSTALTITAIQVFDGRTGVDTQELTTPKFTFKKISDSFVPKLTPDQEKIIKDEIAQYTKGGKSVSVKATLKKGTKEFSMGFFSGREYVSAAVNIELLDSSNTQLFSTTGEADYEVKSTKANAAFIESLYRKAIKTCIYKAFESIQDFLEKQSKEK